MMTSDYQQEKMLEIESNISKLLLTTKRLLETLTGWSAGEVKDIQVYQEYNLLETYFKNSITAFESVLLSIEDIINLPVELLTCLKEILSKEPSSNILEQYLPIIRDIILKLLQSLKQKQTILRERYANMTTVFIKHNKRVKKVYIRKEQSMDELLDLFSNSFLIANPQDYMIYILDAPTNIEYELEDLSDIQPNTMLILKDIKFNNNDDLKDLIETTIKNALNTDKLLLEKEEEVNALKKELNDCHIKFKVELDELKNDDNLHNEMDEKRKVTQKNATLITNRLENLQDKMDQLKLDVTQRKCKPSKIQLNHFESELDFLKKELSHLDESIKTVKPNWKKTWENELQQIVKEQQFLKEQEALLIDLNEDITSLFDVFNQLLKIYEINERKKKLGPKQPIQTDQEFEGMKTVLQQLVSSVQIDHSKRVKALEDAETKRSKELSQRIDEFERELNDFVELKKLKNIGGTQSIEKIRQEKDKKIIQDIIQSKTIE